jgi:hypothetical protein
MKTNRKTHHRGVVLDSVLSAPITLLLTLLLIASAALDGDKVLAQSKRKPTGSPGAQMKPPSAVVPDERDPYAAPEILAQLANDKLDELTEKEAPELMEALHSAQRIKSRLTWLGCCPVDRGSHGQGLVRDLSFGSRYASPGRDRSSEAMGVQTLCGRSDGRRAVFRIQMKSYQLLREQTVRPGAKCAEPLGQRPLRHHPRMNFSY